MVEYLRYVSVLAVLVIFFIYCFLGLFFIHAGTVVTETRRRKGIRYSTTHYEIIYDYNKY